jgi:hypothetical protein
LTLNILSQGDNYWWALNQNINPRFL